MAIALVGAAQAATSANGATISLTKPSGVATGDLLLALVAGNDNSITATGFTSSTSQSATATGNSFRLTILYRYVDGSEGSSFTFTNSGGTGAPIAGVLAAYSGVVSSSPVSIGARTGSSASSSEPYAISSLSTTGDGMGFAVRACRFSDSTNQPTTLVTFSDSDADTTYRANARALSTSNNTQYAVGMFEFGTPVTNGGSISASISHNGPNPPNESDNLYAIFALKAAPLPATGTIDSSVPSITSAFAGTMTTPTGDVTSTLPSITSLFDGVATPPSGSIDSTLPSITSAFVGGQSHGAVTSQVPSITSAFVGGQSHGAITSTLPLVATAIDGGIIWGTLTSQLPSLTVDLLAESRKFGEHVITVEAEPRAFRVTDDGTGLVQIKRSQVTDA